MKPFMLDAQSDLRRQRLATLLRRVLVASEFGVLLFSGGCVHRPCYDVGIDSGGKYRADLVEVYNGQSTFVYEPGIGWSNGTSNGPCAGADGLVAATSLELQGTGMSDDRTDTCELTTANLASAPAPIQLLGSSSDPVAISQTLIGQPLMYAVEDVTIGSCTGVLGLDILSGHGAGGVFATPTPGELPPALLYALFMPNSGTCQVCDDNFVIHLVKE